MASFLWWHLQFCFEILDGNNRNVTVPCLFFFSIMWLLTFQNDLTVGEFVIMIGGELHTQRSAEQALPNILECSLHMLNQLTHLMWIGRCTLLFRTLLSWDFMCRGFPQIVLPGRHCSKPRPFPPLCIVFTFFMIPQKHTVEFCYPII